jgi:histidine ammonia-lyase
MHYKIGVRKRLKIEDAIQMQNLSSKVTIASNVLQQIAKGRRVLKAHLNRGMVVYGINTGFGALCDTRISESELKQLQLNLIRSHTAGVGNEVPLPLSRLMLFLKLYALCKGVSGVSVELVQFLQWMFNKGIIPVVYDTGSLGASGDLAPLAQLFLPVIGEGEVWYEGKYWNTRALYEQLNVQPLQLEEKEGLALINGTQFMLAYAVEIVFLLEKLLNHWLDLVGECCRLFRVRKEPFEPYTHRFASNPYQRWVAERILAALDEHEEAEVVQDPYAFRCIPQVYGALWETFHHCKQVVEQELETVSDNPLIAETGVLSGGNFHGQRLALVLDQLGIALAEWGSMSERRIYQMLSGKRGLPKFLAWSPGINSGLMILQYTAAALVNQLVQMAQPNSLYSIPSSDGQEDYVSMGANAATRLYQMVKISLQLFVLEWYVVQEAKVHRQENPDPLFSRLNFTKNDRIHAQNLKILFHTFLQKFRNL